MFTTSTEKINHIRSRFIRKNNLIPINNHLKYVVISWLLTPLFRPGGSCLVTEDSFPLHVLSQNKKKRTNFPQGGHKSGEFYPFFQLTSKVFARHDFLKVWLSIFERQSLIIIASESKTFFSPGNSDVKHWSWTKKKFIFWCKSHETKTLECADISWEFYCAATN